MQNPCNVKGSRTCTNIVLEFHFSLRLVIFNFQINKEDLEMFLGQICNITKS